MNAPMLFENLAWSPLGQPPRDGQLVLLTDGESVTWGYVERRGS